MEDILKYIAFVDKKSSDKWYPNSVSCYEDSLNISKTYKGYQLKKNIAYELQFIEFIQKQLDELNTSDIIKRMLCKDFILHSMSIIECMFVDLLHKNNKWKIDKKTNQKSDKMTLFEIISSVRDNKLVVFPDISFWEKLCEYRELRNTIHLHIAKNDKVDYWKFEIDEQEKMKKILYKVLTNPVFCTNELNCKNIYEFLNNTQFGF